MTAQCATTGDGHTAPCAWSKTTIATASILLTVGAYSVGALNTRMAINERQLSEARETQAAMRASIEYIQRDIGEIKASLRREDPPHR